MSVATRFLLTTLLFSSIANAFSQKILIIKSPIKGLDKTTLTAVDVSRFKDSSQYWDWQLEKELQPGLDGNYTISTSANCIRLSRGPNYGAKYEPQKPQTDYSTLFINNIHSYPSDTIVIAGLSFSSYYSRKLVRSI